MGNSISGTVTKLLTLLPLLVAVYFFDFPKFFTVLTTTGQGALFVVAMSLFVLGIILKRKILGARLELSRPSFVWGVPLLLVAVLLYSYGSFSTNGVWYHYESLCVLIVSYVIMRIGSGIFRALSPLFLILILAFPLTGFFGGVNDHLVITFFSFDLVFVLFLTFVGLRLKSMIIPSVLLLLGLFAWYRSPFPLFGHQFDLTFLIPVPLLLLFIPKVRRFVSLPNATPFLACSEHRLLPDGFCSICGSKLARARTTENFGLWGLLAVIAVTALLVFTTIPVLAVIGGAPYDAYYTAHGYSGTITPSIPSGWQVNSTARYDFPTDTYAIKQVYVPLFHPETKNYTMYYELAPIAPPYTNGTFGGDIPGWNRTNLLNNDVQLGPFQGHLTTYVASNKVMLAYLGTTTMLFLNGSTFVRYSVGLGFIREFKNSNVSSDTTQFLGDLNALWLPALNADVSYSGWTNFLYGLDQGALALGQSALLVSSVVAIIWVGYRASLPDERLDHFISVASVQSEEYWSYLSRLLELPHHAGTGLQLSTEADASSPRKVERLDSTLHELENRHLVTRALIERGADIISVWKAAV